MKRWSAVVLALGVVSIAAHALADWQLLKLDLIHSRIAFTATTPLFDVTGRFKRYELQVDGDPTKPTQAKLKFIIDVDSVDTGNANRDAHLVGPNFLDGRRFPHIAFTSERIWQTGPTLTVRGKLALHGREKTLNIPFKVVTGKNEAGMDATSYRGKLTIRRKDYELGAASVVAELGLQDAIAIDLLLVWLR